MLITFFNYVIDYFFCFLLFSALFVKLTGSQNCLIAIDCRYLGNDISNSISQKLNSFQNFILKFFPQKILFRSCVLKIIFHKIYSKNFISLNNFIFECVCFIPFYSVDIKIVNVLFISIFWFFHFVRFHYSCQRQHLQTAKLIKTHYSRYYRYKINSSNQFLVSSDDNVEIATWISTY